MAGIVWFVAYHRHHLPDYSVDDAIINKYEAVGRMRIAKDAQVLGKNLP
jgi:hypothetical protein